MLSIVNIEVVLMMIMLSMMTEIKLAIFLQGEIHLKRRLSGLPVNMHCRVAPSLYSVL